MNDPRYWLYWVVAFFGICTLLMIAAAVQEWLTWRKQNRKRR